MRLRAEQVNALHRAIQKTIQPNQYDLYLYGSRTEDHLSGGDIDLILAAHDAGIYQNAKDHCFDILNHIKKMNPSAIEKWI